MAPNRFVKVANRSENAAAYADALREEGYRHLLISHREGRRLGDQYGVFHFSENGAAVWTAFSKDRLRAVFDSPGRCTVYAIR